MTHESWGYQTGKDLGDLVAGAEINPELLAYAQPLTLVDSTSTEPCILTGIEKDENKWRVNTVGQRQDEWTGPERRQVDLSQIPGLELVIQDQNKPFPRVKFQYFKQNTGYEKVVANPNEDFKRECLIVGIGYGVHEQHINKIGAKAIPEIPTPYFIAIQMNKNLKDGVIEDSEIASFATEYQAATPEARLQMMGAEGTKKYFKQFPLSRIRHGPYGEPHEIKDTFKTF